MITKKYNRLNIGLLIDDLDNPFSRSASIGAGLAAKHKDANLFIFPMKYLESIHEISREDDNGKDFTYQYSILYKLITEKNIDILYIMLGTIGTRAKEEEQREFLYKLPNIPKVMLFTKIDGYPGVVFENRSGFMTEIEHLIKIHGARKIGYVSGPLTNMDAKKRLTIYKETLEKNNIEFKEQRVVYGDFESDSEAAVEQLVSTNPDLDAVIFANDLMAISGYRIFEKHKMVIGKDILVAGFDNSVMAAGLIPPLTTVESNPNMLTYKAVMAVDKFINKEMDILDISTHFVQRTSCGCDEFNFFEMYKRMGIEDFENPKLDIEKIYEILFEEYVDDAAIDGIKIKIKKILDDCVEVIENKDFKTGRSRIRSGVLDVVMTDEFKYTTIDKMANVMTATQYLFLQNADDDRDRYAISELFSELFRFLMRLSSRFYSKKEHNMTLVSEIAACISDYTIKFGGENMEFFRSVCEKLRTTGFEKMYIYTFNYPVKYRSKLKWIQNEKLKLQIYFDEVDTHIPTKNNEVKFEDILINDFTPSDRTNMIFLPLYSSNELYGIMMFKTEAEYLDCITPICTHISLAIKSMILAGKQRRVQEKLEKNLQLIKKDNEELNEISNFDSLTHVFNRRGFVTGTEKIINSPDNEGKICYIVSADLDNLKYINDNFGHDEGDFAIKEISKILVEAFSPGCVVGRLGGDEFAVSGIVENPNDFSEPELIDNVEYVSNEMLKKQLYKKIDFLIKTHNEVSNKQYFVDSSVGICFFKCKGIMNIEKIYDIADRYMYERKREKKKKNSSYR